MAHFDKYEPLANGFRARLAAAWGNETNDQRDGVPFGVGLDASGHVVRGAGVTGVVGVLILIKESKNAGEVVDVMTSGEIVEAEGFTAGDLVFAAAADGALSTTNTGTPVGFTVEADRIVVRMAA